MKTPLCTYSAPNGGTAGESFTHISITAWSDSFGSVTLTLSDYDSRNPPGTGFGKPFRTWPSDDPEITQPCIGMLRVRQGFNPETDPPVTELEISAFYDGLLS